MPSVIEAQVAARLVHIPLRGLAADESGTRRNPTLAAPAVAARLQRPADLGAGDFLFAQPDLAAEPAQTSRASAFSISGSH